MTKKEVAEMLEKHGILAKCKRYLGVERLLEVMVFEVLVTAETGVKL